MTNSDLNCIPEPTVYPDDDNDPLVQTEADNLDLQKAREEVKTSIIRNQMMQEDLNRVKTDNNQRLFVQQNVWDLIKIWLACVLLLTLFSGIERGIPLCQRSGAELTCQTFVLHYEKEVLIALISSPTVAIIGLAVIVLKYLFPSKDGK